MALADTQVVYTVSHAEIGASAVMNGRSFVWCSHTSSTTLVRGEPLVINPTYDGRNLLTSTNALNVGMTAITGITAYGAIAANAFAEGYMAVVNGGGEGNIYKIRDHTAFSASSADATVVLYDPIVVASDADTQVTLIAHKYANPQKSETMGANSFVGVPNVTVGDGSTTTQFFWAQRNGLCPTFIDGTPKSGISVMVSEQVDGRLASVTRELRVEQSPTGATTEKGSGYTGGGSTFHRLDETPVVGQMATDAIDGEVQIVDLQNPLF